MTVIGEVVSEFTYSHEVFGEGFYMVDILVRRLSNSNDRIPVMVSERLIDVTQDYRGMCMMISGQFRSYNRHEEQKNRLVLSVFARTGRGEDEPYPAGRIYVQETGVQEDAAGTRDRRPAAGGEPALREIRLHPVYLLGEERPLCVRL